MGVSQARRMVFVRENPTNKWMMTGGTPMAMETAILISHYNDIAFSSPDILFVVGSSTIQRVVPSANSTYNYGKSTFLVGHVS